MYRSTIIGALAAAVVGTAFRPARNSMSRPMSSARPPMDFTGFRSIGALRRSRPRTKPFEYSTRSSVRRAFRKDLIRASGDVANAAAFLDDTGARVIAYNVLFMDEVKQKTGRYWSLISVMAHEVGHHLNFHTYVKGMPPPEESRKDELEADYFSGHALARLGASLDDALAAMRAISPVDETSSHPGREARLQAIALGWKAAVRPNTDPNPAPTDPPPHRRDAGAYRPPLRRLAQSRCRCLYRAMGARRGKDQPQVGSAAVDATARSRPDQPVPEARAGSGKLRPTFQGFSNGTATFDVTYSFTMEFKSGKPFRESACESYKLRKRGDTWAIIENQDYKPCR